MKRFSPKNTNIFLTIYSYLLSHPAFFLFVSIVSLYFNSLFAISGPTKDQHTDRIIIAVASNFKNTALKIANAFHTNASSLQESQLRENQLTFSFASTGKLYSQIIQGAPFDMFLAADEDHPLQLEKNEDHFTNNRFTYAIGQLALIINPKISLSDQKFSSSKIHLNREIINFFHSSFPAHISIANPKLAPYGRATQETLEKLSIWKDLKERRFNKVLVQGESINQAFQFIWTGQVAVGFVAYAQVLHLKIAPNNYRLISSELHRPIKQQAILLSDHPVASRFSQFLTNETSREIIKEDGYLLP